jgi:N-acetylmuramoyl-L-alanine amidase
VQYAGGRDNSFVITTGRRFQTLKAMEQDGPPRLVVEILGTALPARPATTAAPATPRSEPSNSPPPSPRVVVVDPGHGGGDHGAKGATGTLEKDVSLVLARRLKNQLVNAHGLQVFLTRERDEDVPLDQRTAVANNYKADLFVSIHANSHRVRSAFGSEVYFLAWQATDDETTWMAQSEGAATNPVVTSAGGAPVSDLSLILWDMAQAEHLQESSLLASRIQEELAVVTGSEGRGVKQAPFRVLVGATMPAVLVEVAFISNPDEEKLLTSEAYQTKVAAALSRGVTRFLAQLEARTGSR